jgi:hypothetical protein
MSDSVNTIPLYLANFSGVTLSQVWTGHYTSKDSNNNLEQSMFYWSRPVANGNTLQVGEINIVSNSSDYWALFFTVKDDENLYGYLKNYKGGSQNQWYSDEASMSYKAVRLQIQSGKTSAILLGSSDGTNYNQFGNSFPLNTLNAV